MTRIILALGTIIALFCAVSTLNSQSKGGGLRYSCAAADIIEGSWEPFEAVQTLLGKAPLTHIKSATFRRDEKALDKFPEKIRKRMKELGWQTHFAGWTVIKIVEDKKEVPFALTTSDGNLFLLYARAKGDDPYGDTETFVVNVAKGDGPEKDILFLAQRPSETFAAFRRVK